MSPGQVGRGGEREAARGETGTLKGTTRGYREGKATATTTTQHPFTTKRTVDKVTTLHSVVLADPREVVIGKLAEKLVGVLHALLVHCIVLLHALDVRVVGYPRDHGVSRSGSVVSCVGRHDRG